MLWELHKLVRAAYHFVIRMLARIARLASRAGATHLPPSHWDMEENADGHLVIGGCDVADLARAYGLPLFVVDERRLRSRYTELVAALREGCPGAGVFYSYKTNPVPGVIGMLHEEGAGAEVISPYELWLAFELGVPADRIIYNGVWKDDASLEIAVGRGIRLINVDSLSEIERLAVLARRTGTRPNVGVRVATGAGWESQFGLSIATGNATRAYRRLLELDCFRICGIHTHLGTSIRHVDTHCQAIGTIAAYLRDLRDDLGLELACVDLGGGLGVPTVQGLWEAEFELPYPSIPDTARAASLQDFARAITGTLAQECRSHGVAQPELILEPGRAITSDAQTLLLTVAALKPRGGDAHYIVADGGLNLAHPVEFEYHELFVANRMGTPATERYTVVGPLCTPTDLLYHNKLLPPVSVGDILAIMDAGAYFTSYMNTFSFPRPGVAVVRDGRHRLVRQPESFAGMTSLDTIQAVRSSTAED